MRIVFIGLLSIFFLQGFAQNPAIKSTDKYVEQVNTFLKENVYIKKPLDHKSAVGGAVTGYYLKNKLQLIAALYNDEFGFVEYSFYVDKDSLLFVKERKVVLKEPVNEKEYVDYEKYVLLNTQNGKTDISKWPLTADITNTYYFQNRKIINYQLKNFNKKLKPAENEIEASNKDLVSRFLVHLEELKGSN